MNAQLDENNPPLTLLIGEGHAAELKQLAAEEGTTVAAIAARVLGNGLFLVRAARDGNRSIMEDRQGARRTLTPA